MKILIVDDEEGVRYSLLELLQENGHLVRAAEHVPAALASLEAEPADLIISDLSMPKMDGLTLLEEVRRSFPDTLFVLMTAYGDERTAVRALKMGAYDYVPKPFDNEEIRSVVRRGQEMLALHTENERLRNELANEFRGLIGNTPAIRDIVKVIRRAGPTDATVLITGESGTGKELVARGLHAESTRASKAFVPLNCSALPGELIESELFGHVRGAFTGADKDRDGLLTSAHGGTLFLDEVGDLAAAAQAKLLRALEERVVTRVGANEESPVDIRVIAATNKALEELVATNRFREDLLYRLQVVTLHIPPLRERREDIPAITTHLIAQLSQKHGHTVRSLSPDARRALLGYDWPGNVRELRNVIERAVVLAETDDLDVRDLPPHVTGRRTGLEPADAALAELPYAEARAQALESFERSFLIAALERHGGNISATSRTLGIHRQSLQKMLRRLEIDRFSAASETRPLGKRIPL